MSRTTKPQPATAISMLALAVASAIAVAVPYALNGKITALEAVPVLVVPVALLAAFYTWRGGPLGVVFGWASVGVGVLATTTEHLSGWYYLTPLVAVTTMMAMIIMCVALADASSAEHTHALKPGRSAEAPQLRH